MYLNNNATQSDDEIEHQKSSEKRRELIENCKHIRSIFEAAFHPHDEAESSSYLDMNGAGMNRNQRTARVDANENGLNIYERPLRAAKKSRSSCVADSSKEDYMPMSDAPENAYDIYDTASPLDQQRDENKCPYTGLPAAHLKIMNSTQAGLLTRIEKKLFFAQSKDFYAGILEKWVLLYPSKSNDMKPSEYFFPKRLDVEKGDNQFAVLTNSGKRFHFQAPNGDEFRDWIKNIKKIIEDGVDSAEGSLFGETPTCQLRETPTSQLISFRKLPSPPPGDETQESRSSSENYYGFNRSSNQTIINNDERLYEEPSNRSADKSDKEPDEEDEEKEGEESSEEKPPSLPAKTGRKGSENDVHGYDVPKPTVRIDEKLDSFDESVSLSASPSPEPSSSFETPEKSRTKVSEMTAILSTINLVSPEEKRKSTHTPKPKSKIATADKHETEKSEKRSSPVKNWFSKQISKSKRRLSKREKTPETDVENDEPMTSVKGAKVNMIINQLEKNGQLKVLSKSLKNRKSSAFDGEDYETVCVRN